MKRILILLLLAVTSQAFAQYEYPDKELCEELKKRTLAIQLLEETGDTEKNLNNALKKIFAEWDLTPVEFMGWDAIAEILDSKNTSYALLLQNDELRKDIRSREVDQYGRKVVGATDPNSNKMAFKQYYEAFTFSYYNFDLLLTTKKKEKSITSVGFANGDLSRIDYVFLYQQLSRLIQSSLNDIPTDEFYNVASNIETCKNSKLVLLRDFFSEKDVPKIDDYYEFEYELVDFESYQDVILNKAENMSYSKIIWSNQINMYEWVVVDAKSGSILSQLTFGGVKFGRNHDANDIIKSKHLKYITNKTAQKVNNKYK
ncbi:MAG: hypothetical protein ABJG78_02985 [Cyclobacteriaceae bacterium]